MSARERTRTHNRVAATATALCQWERAPQGGLRATWRPGCRVPRGADAGGHTGKAATRLTDRQHEDAPCGSAGSARQRPAGRLIAGGFIAALYLVVAFAGVAIVVQV
jgi:hypothetical protein